MIHRPTILCFRCRFCDQCILCERHADTCKLAAGAAKTPTCAGAAVPVGTTALGALIGVLS